MALNKSVLNINFGSGLETKSDDKQVPLGKFINLENSVFTTTNRLTKRNGYPVFTTLPNDTQTVLTTYNDTLVATGSNLYAYTEAIDAWSDKGIVQPVSLSVKSLLRNTASQSSIDMAVSESGIAVLTYVESGDSYYLVADVNTGQQIVEATALPTGAKSPRVFLLGTKFIITFLREVIGVPHLQYLVIPAVDPTNPGSAVDFSITVESDTTGYQGIIANGNLFLAWTGDNSDIKLSYLTPTLSIASPAVITGETAELISLALDDSTAVPTIWLTWWEGTTNLAKTIGYTALLAPSVAQLTVFTEEITQLTSIVIGSSLYVFSEVLNYYDDTGDYPTHTQTDYINLTTVTLAGSLIGTSTLLRSVGLASRAFTPDGDNAYMLVAYGEANQPTYFIMNAAGDLIARLAYGNGGGYVTGQVLPKLSEIDGTFYAPYLIKDFLAPVNKGTDLPSGTPTTAIYTQTGVNLTQFTINESNQYNSTIGNALHLTGGQMWEYDGSLPVEHSFHVYPENVVAETSTASGSITADTYFYTFCYEWTDNQGMLHRSAPSIPVEVTTTGSTSRNTLYVPTLRLTYKIDNPVRIVGYRYSVGQPVYYQFTSIVSPTLNNVAVDYVTITDSVADASILGQTILYTTGGVLENIAAPASSHSTTFKNRVVLINAENENELWYSKPVLQNTPVEFSDLQTIFISPVGPQGPTGGCKVVSSMDDKLIIFKRNAAYYQTGNGPDITGANNDFIDPTYITGTVGCDNPDSVVLTPNGLMFQSDKGIWLMDRALNTTYVGAPVEAYNGLLVRSAEMIPGTTQVRFVLEDNITLMYDYFQDQWGTFTNTRAISACIHNNRHTYLNEFGQVLQDTDGSYSDASRPVLLSLTTPWVNVAGLQGYERLYFMHLLGTYKTPFKLNVQIAYDYNSSPEQNIIVTPDNYAVPYGDEALWGSGRPWGGSEGNVFEARIFPQIQKCQAFQVTITEVFDPSFGTSPGEGLNLSGLALTIGVKKGYRVQRASKSFG